MLWVESLEDGLPPEPGPGENDDKVVPGCTEYRAIFVRPGYCWCGPRRKNFKTTRAGARARILHRSAYSSNMLFRKSVEVKGN